MITKTEYLRARMSDKSKVEVAREAGISVQKLYQLLDQWQIMTAEDERKAINILAGNSSAFDNEPVIEARRNRTETKSEKGEIKAVKNETSSMEHEFFWILPVTQASTIRVTKNGVRITGDVAKRFKPGEHVRIGVSKDTVAIQRLSEDRKGWKIKSEKNNGSVLISGKTVIRAINARGIQCGTVLNALWDEQNQWVVSHNESRG